jgi:2Fe-2S ferredoxin
MTTVTVLPHAELCPQGAAFEAPEGVSLCDALLANGIAIEHACDRSCACTTCHVVIRAGFDSLAGAEEKEEDLLDRAWGLEATSRLSCQAKLGAAAITIDIPKYTLNHARENH